jgi:hypothetical protein
MWQLVDRRRFVIITLFFVVGVLAIVSRSSGQSTATKRLKPGPVQVIAAVRVPAVMRLTVQGAHLIP